VSTGHPPRHKVVAAALTSATMLALAACGGESAGSSHSGGGSVTVVSYGGDYQEAQQKALFDPYMAQNDGVEVRTDSPTDYAKLKAMVEAGATTWDLALVGNDFGHDTQAEWLEPIDYSVIDKDSIVEGYAGEYRIAADIEGTVIAYRSDKYDTAPKTWADFFDTETFPGKRGVYKWVAGGIIEGALLADGVAAEDLYPLDVDRALAKLDTIKDDIVWWETSAQSQQNMASGETPIAMAWVGRAVAAAEEAPVSIAWDEWLSQEGYWVIPKGANKDAAMQLLKYMVSEEAQLAQTELLPYGPVSKAAAEQISADEQPNLPTSHLDTQIKVDDTWWADNQAEIDEQFQAWLLQ
jgi:putative spermidine/putrescine transport system substrate-binding protein